MKNLFLVFGLSLSGLNCAAAESYQGRCVFTYDGGMQSVGPFQVDAGGAKLGQVEFKDGGTVTYRIEVSKGASNDPTFVLDVSFKRRQADGTMKLVNAGEVFAAKTKPNGRELAAQIDLLNPRIVDLQSVTSERLSYKQARKLLGIDDTEGTMLGAYCSLK